MKITAAHDFNDYEVYKRHSAVVPLINLMTADARMVDEPHMPEQYRGLDRYECRKRVVADLEAMNLVAKIEPHTHMVPHGDRSGVVIEPWLTEQWYVDVKPLADKAMAAVRAGKTKFHPPERAKIFFNWLENIEPWCISRQLWWGHQIPAWYGPDKHVFVAETEEQAQAAADRHYGRVVPLTRDPDVLDTWFSSALWPYSTLGWPAKTPELAKFYPNDVLVTGADILFFWVARMMMTGIHFMEEVPFRDVVLHGIVRDEKGKKMSKTTGNVVDPLTVIDQYGADALRFTLAAMTMQGRDIKLAMSRVEGYRNFATKVWNAARFAEVNGCARVAGFDPKALKSSLNRWPSPRRPLLLRRSPRRSRASASTRRRMRPTASSGAPSATGTSSCRSRSCRGPTGRRRRRRRAPSPSSSTSSARSCTRSCPISPRSSGRRRRASARRVPRSATETRCSASRTGPISAASPTLRRRPSSASWWRSCRRSAPSAPR